MTSSTAPHAAASWLALARKHALPVHFIGVGEGVDDLAPFAARDFANAIAGIRVMTKKPQLNPLLKLALEMGR